MITPIRLLLDTPQIIQDPLTYLTSVTEQHGKIVQFDVGNMQAYFVNDAEGVEQVLVKNSKNYSKDTVQFKTFGLVTGNGLLNSDGAFWMNQRRMMQPTFHRKKLVQWENYITEAAEKLPERWASLPQPMNMEHEMMRYSLGIISHVLFGLDITERLDEMVHHFDHALEYVIFRSRMPLDAIESVPLPVVKRYKDAMNAVTAWISGIINRRRLSGEYGDDFLGILLDGTDEHDVPLTDKQIQDEMMTMILAGYETVATGLTWLWSLLDEHPIVLREIQEELRTVLQGKTPTHEDLPNLPKLNQAIHESWRMYPPAWVVSRQAIEDDVVMGVTIPAGALVIISPYVLQRTGDHWPNPEQFDATRFADEAVKSRPSQSYIPFGAGNRLCIGKAFAELESMLVMATVLQKVSFKYMGDRPIPYDALVTIRPKNGLPVFVVVE